MKPLQRQTAEVLVKVLAVYIIISGAFCILYSLFLPMLFLSTPTPDQNVGLAVGLIIGVFMLVMGVLFILLGRGLWQFKNWARITQIVLTWVGIVFSIIFVVFIFVVLATVQNSASAPETSPVPAYFMMGFMLIFSLLYSGLVLWLLQFEPTAKSLFVSGKPGKSSKR